MDDADKVFTGVCDKCGKRFDEPDPCTLEVRIQRHKCVQVVEERVEKIKQYTTKGMFC